MKNPREGDTITVEIPVMIRTLRGRTKSVPEMTDNRNKRKRTIVDWSKGNKKSCFFKTYSSSQFRNLCKVFFVDPYTVFFKFYERYKFFL